MTNSPPSLSAFDYSKLDDLEQIILTEAQRRRDTNRIADVYPDEGPLRRELYPKHIAFFKAGATHMERAAIAANRVGKTWGIGGFETTLHLTGDYPEGGRDGGLITRSRHGWRVIQDRPRATSFKMR
jgi:hypothetical protein